MLTFEEFKNYFPDSILPEDRFATQLFMAESVLAGHVCRRPECLTGKCLDAYKRALALQIDHVQTHGQYNDGLVSQNVNGQSATFQTSARRGDVNISPLAIKVLWNAGLSVC